jgi:C2 domain
VALFSFVFTHLPTVSSPSLLFPRLPNGNIYLLLLLLLADAYAVVIPQNPRFGKTFTTSVVKNSYNPKWKASKTVKMPHQTYVDIYNNSAKSELAFRIEVYDRDAVGKDDFIGVAEISTDHFQALNKSKVPLKLEAEYAKSKAACLVVSTLWFKQFKAGGGSGGIMSQWGTEAPVTMPGWEVC